MKFSARVACVFLVLSGRVLEAALLDPPVFNRPSGTVPTGFAFTLTNVNSSGAVMFTMDSMDPRNVDGTVYTNARAAWAAVTVNRTTTVKARVLSGVAWSDLVEATFVTSSDYTKLLITELMYQPPGTNGTHERSREFIELKNVGVAPLDISGVTIQGFSFPTQTVIAPGEFKVLIQNTNAYLLDHPGGLMSGQYPFRLQNGDSEVHMFHASGAPLFSMSYLTHGPWPTVPDDHNFTERGFSLVTADPNAVPRPHHYRSWRASAFEGGSPGADDPPDTRPRIKLTEVLARPDSAGYPFEAIELYNPYSTNVDIGGWFFSDSRPQPKGGYQIPANTIVSASSFLVIDQRQFGADPSNRVALSSEGEGVYVFSATTNRNLTGYSDGDETMGSERGMTYGLVVNSVGDELFVPLSSQTLGASNSAPAIGPIVINEFNYYSSSNGTRMFMELMNITDDWVPLFDLQNPQYTWRLYAGDFFVFPPDVLIAPRSFFLVVVQDPEAFRLSHAVPDEVPIFGPIRYDPEWLKYGAGLLRPSGVINDASGIRPRMIPVESINFERQHPWPPAANGAGSSLQRLATHEFGNDPKNWRAGAAMSPGHPNFTRPIDGWKAYHFGAAQLSDPAIGGDDSDPDGDGLSNVSEYAFGLDPKTPGRVPMRIEIVGSRLTASFRKSEAATDIEVFGEAAGNVAGPWSSQDVEMDLNWPQTVLRDRVNAGSMRFLRIRAALRD